MNAMGVTDNARVMGIVETITKSTGVTLSLVMACVTGAFVTGIAVARNAEKTERNSDEIAEIRRTVEKLENIADTNKELSIKLTYLAEGNTKRLDLLEQAIRIMTHMPMANGNQLNANPN